MQFINPRTDFAFKKIFGSDDSDDILLSFLNAMLDLPAPIVGVTILDPYQVPRIKGMKDTFVDVRATDTTGRQFIVEMQVLNVAGFEKRILHNACKAYSSQLAVGDGYVSLTNVIALTITDFLMFPERPDLVSRYQLRAHDGHLFNEDIELVFVELPKFTKTEGDLVGLRDKWLYFLRHALDLRVVPESLQQEPPIAHAFQIANHAGLTREEDHEQTQRVFWIQTQRLAEAARLAAAEALTAEREKVAAEKEKVAAEKATVAAQAKELAAQEQVLAEQGQTLAAQGQELSVTKQALVQSEQALAQVNRQIAQTLAQTAADGLRAGQAQALRRLLARRFGDLTASANAHIDAANSAQIEAWLDRALDASSVDEMFKPQT
jgi:predicted transposase/invertase (TIGR01784 family)